MILDASVSSRVESYHTASMERTYLQVQCYPLIEKRGGGNLNAGYSVSNTRLKWADPIADC
jgi:hypothetical protein